MMYLLNACLARLNARPACDESYDEAFGKATRKNGFDATVGEILT